MFVGKCEIFYGVRRIFEYWGKSEANASLPQRGWTPLPIGPTNATWGLFRCFPGARLTLLDDWRVSCLCVAHHDARPRR